MAVYLENGIQTSDWIEYLCQGGYLSVTGLLGNQLHVRVFLPKAVNVTHELKLLLNEHEMETLGKFYAVWKASRRVESKLEIMKRNMRRQTDAST